MVNESEWNVIQLVRKKIMKFSGKGVKLETIIISNVIQTQKDRKAQEQKIKCLYWMLQTNKEKAQSQG